MMQESGCCPDDPLAPLVCCHWAEHEDHAAALTIYEVLVTEVIEHYNDYRDEYVAFSVNLTGCIDGLDTCFAGEEDNQEIRLRVLYQCAF